MPSFWGRSWIASGPEPDAMGPVLTRAECTIGCITGGATGRRASRMRDICSRSSGLSSMGEVPTTFPCPTSSMRPVSSIASAASATCGPDSTSQACFSSCGGGAERGTTFCTAASSAVRSKGFSKYASAPYFPSAIAEALPPLCTPDMKMKGMRSFLNASATSNPIRSGSSTSTTARSGRSLRASSSAVRPRAAVATM